MNQIAISKTLLVIWPGLADYAATLGEQARNHALCSCNTPLFTRRVIDKIIELNVKQQMIHNLNTRMNQVVGKLPPEIQRVLHLYYQTYGQATDVASLAKKLKISERTFYRHVDRAIIYVGNHLNAAGINFFTWQDLLHQHPWIRETFMHQFPLTPPQRKPRQTGLSR